jgi:uncharacterized repeat protein (TIGR03837 family)
MPQHVQRWDLFCSVIDNYGDAGVCWRLARQLAGEHRLTVRIFIDALLALSRIEHRVDPTRDQQTVDGVSVCRWAGPQAAFPPIDAGDVVIEAFGCGMPRAYLETMAARRPQPVWVNLEYLSAESWIEGCHGLPSRHPTLPLTRHFFFPGFTAASGGLLRERDLFSRRDAFLADASAQAALWKTMKVVKPGPDVHVVSLFCYANAPVLQLLHAWADGAEPTLCLVPEGVAEATLETWSGGAVSCAGQQHSRGRLTVARVPFLDQDGYDRLLWSCGLNFVRGEDSFVRAQWAARPLVWQPYLQAENAHRLKLVAFLGRYAGSLANDAAASLGAFSSAWSGDGEARAPWERLSSALPLLSRHAQAWSVGLASMPDLATNLVKLCASRV